MIAGTGGFLGTIARFLVSRFMHRIFLVSFPIGTFTVNIIGCLLIGILFGISEKGDLLTPEWRIFLTTGFCGGFTTFSTFSLENISLLKDGNFLFFALYTGLSVALGLLATYAGHLITMKLI